VDGPERDALLARLANDDDDLALFAEAAAIQRALEEEDAAARMTDAPVPHGAAAAGDGPARVADDDNDLARFAEAAAARARENASAGIGDGAGTHAAPAVADADEPVHDPDVIPIRGRRPQRVDRRLVLAAAVLAGVTLLPLAWTAGRPGAVSSPSQAVAMLDDSDAGVPAGFNEGRWPVRRGGSDPAAERSASAKVGALAVDLELAIRAGNAEQRQQFVGEIQQLLSNTSALADVGFRDLGESTGMDREQQLSALESAVETATPFLDEDFVALGGWAQAARLAAERQDAEFFSSPRTARTLDRAQPLLAEDEQGRAALTAIAAARAADPPDWTALRGAVDALLYAIAS
jgi:hypothetical protein